jgi:hypothetical protein
MGDREIVGKGAFASFRYQRQAERESCLKTRMRPNPPLIAGQMEIPRVPSPFSTVEGRDAIEEAYGLLPTNRRGQYRMVEASRGR